MVKVDKQREDPYQSDQRKGSRNDRWWWNLENSQNTPESATKNWKSLKPRIQDGVTGRIQASSQVGFCLIPTLYAAPPLPVLSQARVSVTDSVRFFLPIVNPSPLLPGLRNAAGLSCNSKASLGTSVQTHYNSALNCLGHKQSNFTDGVFLVPVIPAL